VGDDSECWSARNEGVLRGETYWLLLCSTTWVILFCVGCEVLTHSLDTDAQFQTTGVRWMDEKDISLASHSRTSLNARLPAY